MAVITSSKASLIPDQQASMSRTVDPALHVYYTCVNGQYSDGTDAFTWEKDEIVLKEISPLHKDVEEDTLLDEYMTDINEQETVVTALSAIAWALSVTKTHALYFELYELYNSYEWTAESKLSQRPALNRARLEVVLKMYQDLPGGLGSRRTPNNSFTLDQLIHDPEVNAAWSRFLTHDAKASR